MAREGAAGTLPVRSVAGRYGLDPSMVHRWIEAFRQHGCSSFKSAGHYTAQFKVDVIKRIDHEGLSVRQAMARFGVGGAETIGRWRRQYDRGGIPALAQVRVRPVMKKKPAAPKPPEQMSQKELLKELEYLRAENAVLKK